MKLRKFGFKRKIRTKNGSSIWSKCNVCSVLYVNIIASPCPKNTFYIALGTGKRKKQIIYEFTKVQLNGFDCEGFSLVQMFECRNDIIRDTRCRIFSSVCISYYFPTILIVYVMCGALFHSFIFHCVHVFGGIAFNIIFFILFCFFFTFSFHFQTSPSNNIK